MAFRWKCAVIGCLLAPVLAGGAGASKLSGFHHFLVNCVLVPGWTVTWLFVWGDEPPSERRFYTDMVWINLVIWAVSGACFGARLGDRWARRR